VSSNFGASRARARARARARKDRNGKLSKPDKRLYYLTARGSATESAALLDVCLRLKLLDEASHQSGKEMVVRVVSMLIRLAQACEQTPDS
jgi:hypothetical protein